MCIDHGGTDILVSEQRLYGTDVVSVFQEMCCETVAKRVRGGVFRDFSSTDRRHPWGSSSSLLMLKNIDGGHALRADTRFRLRPARPQHKNATDRVVLAAYLIVTDKRGRISGGIRMAVAPNPNRACMPPPKQPAGRVCSFPSRMHQAPAGHAPNAEISRRVD